MNILKFFDQWNSLTKPPSAAARAKHSTERAADSFILTADARTGRARPERQLRWYLIEQNMKME